MKKWKLIPTPNDNVDGEFNVIETEDGEPVVVFFPHEGYSISDEYLRQFVEDHNRLADE